MSFDPAAKRMSDDELAKLILAPDPAARSPYTARQQLQQATAKFLKDEGATVQLEPGRGKNGTIFVQSGGSQMKGALPPLPSVVVATEHYNRIVRIIKKGIPVTLEIEVQARFTEDDLQGF